MNKKIKFASTVLATSLLLTPISGLVSQYYNVAKATEYTINSNKQIKQVDILSPEDTKFLIEKLYQKNLIKPEKYKELKSMTEDRAFWGSVYVVTFWDNAKDVHIPGWLFSSLAVFSAIAVATVIAEVAATTPAVAAIMGTPTAKGLQWIGNIIVGGFVFDSLKNGIVLYYKPISVDRPYTHVFDHVRVDY